MASSRPLCDAPQRSYAGKLERFARFIAPELRGLFAELAIGPRACVLDLGCGVGIATRMLAEQLDRESRVVGVDLSLPHLRAARATRGRELSLLQADAAQLCFRAGAFDLVWSCNTINHLADPVGALTRLRATLRPGGRIVLAQSGLLPEMYFAWDAPLDEAVRRACHDYYRERYGLEVEDTAEIRGLIRLLRRAGLRVGQVRTLVIERVQPLSEIDCAYFEEAIFRGTWGERLRPFLTREQWQALCNYTDPASPGYSLDREDFHHLQTLTVCVGHA
ncbi:MAG TPA: methyltransferase domain-containing protein [Steroidobacteraceae bacterium]|nr:methyltransferase domain-containing protein [Steroidobacteraceae bacterium]